ncbi:MAG: hypothetical protein ACHQET_06090 [Chitinophagales bacterium]
MNLLTILPVIFAKLKDPVNRSLVITLCFCAFLMANSRITQAQKKLSQADSTAYLKHIQFIRRGADLLPQLIENREWLQLRNFIDNWRLSQASSDELIFSFSTLLDIEEGKFSVYHFPCNYIRLLEDYSKKLKESEDHAEKFKYEIKLEGRYWYNATNDAKKLLTQIRAWSFKLLRFGQLDQTEILFCKIFAGEIRDPAKEIQYASQTHQDLRSLARDRDTSNQAYFFYQRNRTVGTVALMTGSWIPTGNLAILGVHPSVGFYFGGRTKWNEFDLICNFRFLNSTSSNYKVLRNDTLYLSNYYGGGYIGFDYTRYIVSKTRYEIGLTAAIAYDYFSIANGISDNSQNAYLDPLTIGSLDFSNGIRLKYFLGPKSFLGIFLKYHLINYCNTGGTDLGGNAFTIDLVYGFH